uniref:Uncharacterized protein n=1 Tax=Arundo donax TaxID=35708 RepID=A0A0A9DUD3_ARUDO
MLYLVQKHYCGDLSFRAISVK